MKFIKLTGCINKKPVWINVSHICSIDLNLNPIGFGSIGGPITCLYISEAHSIGVLETPEEILALLEDNSNNMQMNMSFPDIFGGKK